MPSDPAGSPTSRTLDESALAALASPARFALFTHLVDHGPQTATQCAEVVGMTASNCSWHLRSLARAGLVEREPGGEDARLRPWRTTADRFDLSGRATPSARATAAAVGRLLDERTAQLHREHLDELGDLPEPWQAVSGSHRLALQVTPEELQTIVTAVEGLVDELRVGQRTDAPADAQPVVFTVTTFLHPHRPA